MDRRAFLAASAATALTAGCSRLPLQGESDLDPEAVSERTHELVNERRETHGESPLGYDEQLEKIAESHSEDMAERGYFSHEDPEGNKWEHRYEEFGYDCEIALDDGRTITGGENIWQIIYKDRSFAASEIARRCVKGWMNSPEHRKNMLRGFWRVEGIGVHVATQGAETTVNVTQNFC